MTTCPECGVQNSDEAKFCDRCGQGLIRAPGGTAGAALPALAPSTELKRGFRIIELISQTSYENRYRAERQMAAGSFGHFQLREQAGPATPNIATAHEQTEASGGHEISPDAIAAQEDPNGPRAKTAELRTAASAAVAGASEAATDDVATARSESTRSPAAEQPIHANGAAVALNDPIVEDDTAQAASDSSTEGAGPVAAFEAATALEAPPADAAAEGAQTTAGLADDESANDDLGEVFGRVMALSMTLDHPALFRATEGFADDGRVYLVYPDEPLTPLSRRAGGLGMTEAEALAVGVQVCQAVSFVNRRGLRVNDICPDSVAFGDDGRIKLTGLDFVSNDNELQAEPIFNDGYTAPEIYKGKKVDKRADVFSAGALLYTCLTGERLEAESWREEAGPIHFYPPHIITPAVEQVVRRALLFDPGSRWPNIDALKAELVALSGIIRVSSATLSDVGMVRELNEDSVMAVEYRRDSLIEPAQNFLYVVADGMGGAEAGEMASAIAVGAIRKYVDSKMGSAGSGGARDLLQAAIEDANTKILEYQAAHPEARGMGSTAVSTLIVPPDAAVSWVGDSRAYFCDRNGLRQITKDHSLVQRLVEIGQITAEEARHHEHKNVITRSLGARPNGPAGAESLSLRLKRGDRLLLCSDGLTAHVDDKSIYEILRRHSDPNEAARELVVAANAGGGTDNVSVVVINAG